MSYVKYFLLTSRENKNTEEFNNSIYKLAVMDIYGTLYENSFKKFLKFF